MVPKSKKLRTPSASNGQYCKQVIFGFFNFLIHDWSFEASRKNQAGCIIQTCVAKTPLLSSILVTTGFEPTTFNCGPSSLPTRPELLLSLTVDFYSIVLHTHTYTQKFKTVGVGRCHKKFHVPRKKTNLIQFLLLSSMFPVF